MDPIRVYFQGHIGLSLVQQQRLRKVEGRVRGASMVFLETNDLADPERDPVLLARDICSLAEYLRIGFDIHKVVISQIIFRDVLPHDNFNNNVVTANESIKSPLILWKMFIFGVIRGWSNNSSIYSWTFLFIRHTSMI